MRPPGYALPLGIVTLALAACSTPRTLGLPPRPADAPSGAALEAELRGHPLAHREARLASEILRGNVPSDLRTLVPVHLGDRTAAAGSLTLWVLPDYLAVGSDDDRWHVPLTPLVAQAIADSLGMSLPTPRMVDAIWAAAAVRLEPSPIEPGPHMTTTPVFLRHSRTVERQRAASGAPGLTAGHKKDVVVTGRLDPSLERVAIYGWHLPDGQPIQPLYLGHTDQWVDYSHGIRLVSRAVTFDGREVDLRELLSDPAIADLLSDEGPLRAPWYRAPG